MKQDYEILSSLEPIEYEIIVESSEENDKHIYELLTTKIRQLPDIKQNEYLRVRYEDSVKKTNYVDTIVVKSVHTNIYSIILDEIKRKNYRYRDNNRIILDRLMTGAIVELKVQLFKKPIFNKPSSKPRFSAPTDRDKIFLYYEDLISDVGRKSVIDYHMNRYIRPYIITSSKDDD